VACLGGLLEGYRVGRGEEEFEDNVETDDEIRMDDGFETDDFETGDDVHHTDYDGL
jgi:hypothetical protein